LERYKVQAGPHTIELGQRTCVMGIVNITPDSFSDGGKFFNPESAVAHGRMMADQGADILDIGGESTRPFSDPVSIDEELRRVIPVIENLSDSINIPISIDTTKAEVARQALAAGASIINDISSLRMDPELPTVVAEFGAPVILMHMLGTPKTMQVKPEYKDVIGEIKAFLGERIEHALENGIPRSSIIIDPGIGFGKTMGHNLEIIKHLGAFEALETPILMGPSRKAFIRHIVKDGQEQDLSPERPEVEVGTQAVVTAAILNGAHIIRVHNVGNTRNTAALADAIRMAGEPAAEPG
jgi:dihydropteroate synthase